MWTSNIPLHYDVIGRVKFIIGSNFRRLMLPESSVIDPTTRPSFDGPPVPCQAALQKLFHHLEFFSTRSHGSPRQLKRQRDPNSKRICPKMWIRTGWPTWGLWNYYGMSLEDSNPPVILTTLKHSFWLEAQSFRSGVSWGKVWHRADVSQIFPQASTKRGS